ncbi:BamA/TamA family outer membrane protein [Nitrospira sp. Nam74]
MQLLLLAPSLACAEPAYAPTQTKNSNASTGDKEAKDKGTPKELIEDQASGEEHALKSLPAKSGTTVIPLPVLAYNRNERYWVGALAPILKANSKGSIEDIWAPQYLFNPLVGHGGNLSYFSYPSDNEQYHAIVWYSQKINEGVDLGYKNVAAGGGRYILAADLTAFKNPFARFFGFGNEASEGAETNFTSRELGTKLTAGINLTPDISLMFTERLRIVRVDDGVVTSLAPTKQIFPGIPGIQGAQVLGHGLTFRYDTRNNQLIPTKGTYVNILAEFNQNLQPNDENQWGHVNVDARHLIPHASDRMVFVSRVMFNGVFGQIEKAATSLGVPFYEQSTLGGEDTLRAFGRNRYIDYYAVLANLEERIAFLEKRIFGHDIQLEIAPFLDIGRVGPREVKLVDLLFKDVQLNPGVGIRLLAKPNVVGRFDLAYGRDGANVFVGIDYPF